MAPSVLVAGEAVRVVREGAEVRSELAFGGRVLARPARGATFELLARDREFLRVRDAEGNVGWLHEAFAAVSALPVPGEAAPAPRLDPPPRQPETTGAPAAEAGEVERLRRERERLSAELQAARDLVELLGAERDRAISDRLALERSLATTDTAAAEAAALARSAAEEVSRLADELAACRRSRNEAEAEAARLRDEPAAGDRCGEAVAEAVAEAERRQRTILEGRHAETLAALEREHEDAMDRFVGYAEDRHQAELARERELMAAERAERITQLRAEHERELRIVSRQSGWEAEFQLRVRDEVRRQLEEERLRWEAGRRGRQIDCDRALAEQERRLRAEAGRERAAAVNEALFTQRTELESQLESERRQEEERCRLALELVLERIEEERGLPELCSSLREMLAAQRGAGLASSVMGEDSADPVRP